MHVEIKNRDAFGAGGDGFERSDGDIVQITKAHGPVAGGVMPGRPHQAENMFAVAGGFQRVKRGGGGGAGVTGNVFIKRRVGIELFRDLQAGEQVRARGRAGFVRQSPTRVRPFDRQFVWLCKYARVRVMRSGRSGWPGLE